MIAGALTGIAIAFAREWLEESLQDSEQLERVAATRCVSTMPALATRAKPEPQCNHEKLSFSSDGVPILTHIVAEPQSSFSDGIRRVAVSVQKVKPKTRPRVIGVIATAPGEGATTAAASLGLLLARTQGQTLLIDADMRQRGLTRILAEEAAIGLHDVINTSFPLSAVMWQDTRSPLRLLPSIHSPAGEHPADLLGAAGMEQLLRAAGKNFLNIVIDLPPLSQAVEAEAMAWLLDELVLVAAKGTPVRKISDALNNAPGLSTKLAGAVLNRA